MDSCNTFSAINLNLKEASSVAVVGNNGYSILPICKQLMQQGHDVTGFDLNIEDVMRYSNGKCATEDVKEYELQSVRFQSCSPAAVKKYDTYVICVAATRTRKQYAKAVRAMLGRSAPLIVLERQVVKQNKSYELSPRRSTRRTPSSIYATLPLTPRTPHAGSPRNMSQMPPNFPMLFSSPELKLNPPALLPPLATRAKPSRSHCVAQGA